MSDVAPNVKTYRHTAVPPYRLVPSPGDILFLLFLAALPLARAWQAINTDGDLGRHLRVGREILEHGLFFTDRFSFTMQGQPFVPYEWLSEILFALSHRWAGFNGVLLLSGLLVATAVWLLNRWLLREGMDAFLAFLVSASAGLAGAFHWLARPHLFSFVGIVAVMWLLGSLGGQDGQAGQGGQGGRLPGLSRLPGRLILGTVLLFALWANLHAGFLYALVLIALVGIGDFLDRLLGTRAEAGTSTALVSRRSSLAPARYFTLLAAALLGSCLTPVGPSILTHIASTLGKSWLLDMTLEMRSPDFHLWYGRLFLILLSACIGGLALSKRPVPFRVLVPFVVTTAFALHSVRNIPLWALSGFPLLVLHLDAEWKAIPSRLLQRIRGSFSLAAGSSQLAAHLPLAAGSSQLEGPQSLATGSSKLEARSSQLPLWPSLFAVAAMAIAWAAPRYPGFDPNVFPVEVVRQARAEGVTGRIFNELAWGGYMLYAWPEQQVFIDGQTDFYGEALARDYMSIRSAEPGWEAKLKAYGVEYVLLPEDAPLARVLGGNGSLQPVLYAPSERRPR